ncbi:MAG TPA: ferritin-like domain-containing protein [Vicinamibacterales bacterium]|nr:ferritin-like domain-containing protein [Vicinamibacterales bacterium]
MKKFEPFENKRVTSRRSFVKRGIVAASAAAAGTGLMGRRASAFSRQAEDDRLAKGDAAILRLLAAAEIIEADLWQQYNELGGVNATASGYTAGLLQLDGDMSQYISDNTDDEISHVQFLNAYLESKGEEPVNFDQFRTVPGSQASGAQPIGRLTNLMQLTVDTSWWTRYRSRRNPDFGATFSQAVPTLGVGQHPAIPRNDAELGDANNISNHVQAIANTAGFHFGFIEQAGTSLYATMSQRVTSLEVLKITLSIGGSEIMHFQTWHDKAGNAVPLTDGDLTFPDLAHNHAELLQANLIMPEPCDFISKQLPRCAIIRPTGPGQIDAIGAINGFIADGLFIGQNPEFVQRLLTMAAEADQAKREL